jgi:hypothetical protein
VDIALHYFISRINWVNKTISKKEVIKTVCDSVNHARFPKHDHLPCRARRDNKVTKGDRIEHPSSGVHKSVRVSVIGDKLCKVKISMTNIYPEYFPRHARRISVVSHRFSNIMCQKMLLLLWDVTVSRPGSIAWLPDWSSVLANAGIAQGWPAVRALAAAIYEATYARAVY